MSVAVSPVIPDAESAAAAAEALERVQAYLRAHPDGPATVRLADDDGGQLVVPRAAVELLSRILAHMANGHGVSVVPAYAELTTQQATDAMKERASASGGCWKVQASVSTRLGGPYVRSLRRP